jgi:hypothetical protein
LLDSDNEMVRDRASTFVLGLADIAPASAPALSAARLSVVPSERHTSARPTSGLSRSGTFLRSHQNCDLSFFRLIGVGIRIVPMV